MMRIPVASLLLTSTLLLTAPLRVTAADETPAEDRWAKDMAKFEELDRTRPTEPGGIVFVGSSSIRLWDLEKSFSGLDALNRGFGGSITADSVRHLDLLVLKHKPRVVVLYAGDNDIARDMTPEEVAGDFQRFVDGVHEPLPEAKIVYIAIKPSIRRWEMASAMREANAKIATLCEKTAHCEFVDVWPEMLGEDGTPRPELFVEDGLHMSPEGYALWTKLVTPHLEDAETE